MNIMQWPATDLPYGTVPGPWAQMVTFFELHLYLARRCCKIPKNARGPAQCKFGTEIKWLVGVKLPIVRFFISSSHPPRQFLCSKYFKKSARGNAQWTNCWSWIEGAWAPWPLMYSYDWLISWQNKNIHRKSSRGLLFTVKILQKAMP